MTIVEYIQNTRKSIGQPNEYLINFYNRIYSIIKKYCPTNFSDITLDIIYSTNKTAEFFYTEIGEKHLIYDQYLGQVFNMLNRLYFNSTEPEAAEYYAFKLLAEEFQLVGNVEAALVCAGAYATKIHEFNSYKKNVSVKDRLNYTLIQEAFILAHELGHYILKKNFDPNIQLLYKKTIIELLTEKYEDISDLDFIDSYLSDRHTTLYGTEDTYKDFLTDAQIQELKEDYIKENFKETGNLIKLVNNNDNLIEELICDDLAVKLTLSFANKEFGINIENSLDALYIGMMNLRILGIINNQVIDFEENKSEVQLYFRTSMIRLMNFREKANYHYGLFLNDMSKGFEIQRKLTETNLRYSSIISDRVLFTIDDKLGLIKAKNKKDTKEIDFDDFILQNDFIDKILNHSK